ncbi:hypothetical protein GGH92_010682, partial [Coemansia sp. RSA 2673]
HRARCYCAGRRPTPPPRLLPAWPLGWEREAGGRTRAGMRNQPCYSQTAATLARVLALSRLPRARERREASQLVSPPTLFAKDGRSEVAASTLAHQ